MTHVEFMIRQGESEKMLGNESFHVEVDLLVYK